MGVRKPVSLEEEVIVGGVGGLDGDAEVVGDVELLRGPDVLRAAGVDVGAALYVVEGGEDEVVFGDCRLPGRTPARWE